MNMSCWVPVGRACLRRAVASTPPRHSKTGGLASATQPRNVRKPLSELFFSVISAPTDRQFRPRGRSAAPVAESGGDFIAACSWSTAIELSRDNEKQWKINDLATGRLGHLSYSKINCRVRRTTTTGGFTKSCRLRSKKVEVSKIISILR